LAHNLYIYSDMALEKHAPALPTIAIVGRPNVGKSTLFNRLTKSRKALVAPVPGTTRDRRESVVTRDNYKFKLIDTGGMGFDDQLEFNREIEQQISRALECADLVWLVVDFREGLNPYDQELYRKLQKSRKKILVVVNKADDPANTQTAMDFMQMTKEEVYPASASHGHGINALLEKTAELIPAIITEQQENGEQEDRPLRIAFLGRPNVGKSSIVNRILGDMRMIVSDKSGTTREAIELPITIEGEDYILIDTAGLKRKAKTHGHLDKISSLNALASLERVDVAVLVLEAGHDIAVQDAKIASEILERKRAVVMALNKWDKAPKSRIAQKEFLEDVREKLRFLPYVELVKVCSLDGQGFNALFKAIHKAAGQYTRKIQTSDINRIIEATVSRTPPPSKERSNTRIYYGLQTGVRPPTFAFYTNNPERITTDYTRYFENQLRYHLGLKGTPIVIQWRAKTSRQKRNR